MWSLGDGSDGTADAERELYVVADGAVVATTQTCVAGETTLTCRDGEVQTLVAYDVGWVEFPLPEGALVDAVPRGYWVLEDQLATPADAVATHYSQVPVTADELVALATDPGSSWPDGVLGIGWGYVFAFLAVLSAVGAGVWLAFRRRRARRAVRASG